MEKIIMLGTGHGFVWNLYNTCFLLENGNRNLLVDTGGGVIFMTFLFLIVIQIIFWDYCGF